MSNIFVHRNPEIFPEPEVFKPERWLGAEGDSLDTWLVAFSKGPRSCLGIKYVASMSDHICSREADCDPSLGWCELYMAFATIIRRYDLVLDGVRCVYAYAGGSYSTTLTISSPAPAIGSGKMLTSRTTTGQSFRFGRRSG